VNPLTGVRVTVYVVFPPALIDWISGLTFRMKLAPVTTSVAVVVSIRLPLVPEIVSGYVPGGVFEVVVMVNVEEPDPVIVSGLKLAEELEGNPTTFKSTTPAKPFVAAVVTV
jgi:hypothetical protein